MADQSDILPKSYQAIAASQTDLVIGNGNLGDVLTGVLIVPGTTAAGAVSIKDGGGSSISLFPGGAVTALVTLIPFFVPFYAKANASGGWKLTTGSNVTAVAFGRFS